MSSEYQIGDQISFYGGRGNIVDISRNGTTEVFEVLTEDGEIQTVSPSQPLVKKVEEATEGDLVNFLGGRAQVVARKDQGGSSDLLYLRTEDGELKKVPADCQGVEPGMSIPDRIQSGQFDDPVRFSLRERAARLSLAYRSDRFLSLSGNRIRIEPYQVDAAHEVLNSYEPRYLIGDEVGLGKTIEAGIIIEELIARGRAERVLILTPASLRDQWQREMREKFGREYVAYDRDYVEAVSRAGKNVWKGEDHIVVSIDFAKQDDMLEQLRELEIEWDIAVFDEAHHLTARESSDGIDRVDRYRVGEAVADNSDALLFLTGTPHKGKPDQFYHLLRLLDPYRFSGPEDITPEKLDDLMIRRMKTDDSMVDADGEPMFPGREITTVPVELTDPERHLYEDLTEYISAVYTASAETDRHAAGFTMVIYQKRLVSSIAAITESLRNRQEDLEEKVTITSDVSEKLHYVDSAAETEADVLDELIEAAENIEVDSKGRRLREFIDGLLDEDSDEKILLFTEYTDTLEYLRDDLLSEYRTTTIHGGMDQEDRRDEIQRFRNDVNILLATDAAREGLNLQFAHIMVNYDLPWNPIRIDQRMGRLHRYGQDETVKIYNLFVEDTRESDILQLLVGKIDQIEADLGMRSDVLGTILDDYDVEGAIMDAVTGQRKSQEVIQDLDEAIEERKAAVQKIESEFLIRDKFDASDQQEIQSLIDLSRKRPIGENDIEHLVGEFCREFGGDVTPTATSNSEEPLYRIEVPDIISMESEVRQQYYPVTFSRSIALDNPNAELVSLNHPLVREIVQYCLEGDWIDGQAAALVAETDVETPGLLATYRLKYVSGDGEVPTEDYARVFIDESGTVHEEIPPITGALPSQLATPNPDAEVIAEDAPGMLSAAEGYAEEEVNELVEEVQDERRQDIEIKEEHAERYFTEKIRELEDRLKEYEKEARDTDKDMQVALDSTRSELRQVENEWEREQERLERERTVIPDEPVLVNAAVVSDRIPAIRLDTLEQTSTTKLGKCIKSGDETPLTYTDSYAELERIEAIESGTVRLLRPVSWTDELTFEEREIDGVRFWQATDDEDRIPDRDILDAFRERIQSLGSFSDASHEIGICLADQPIDAIAHQDRILYNYRLEETVGEMSSVYWQTVTARELVYSDSEIPPERRIEQITRLLTGLRKVPRTDESRN